MSIMLYEAAWKQADTRKTDQLLGTAETNILGAIIGKTRWARLGNLDMRQQCGIVDVGKFIKQQRKEWNVHVDRAGNMRLIRAARDKSPSRWRGVGRHQKQWCEGWMSPGNVWRRTSPACLHKTEEEFKCPRKKADCWPPLSTPTELVHVAVLLTAHTILEHSFPFISSKPVT